MNISTNILDECLNYLHKSLYNRYIILRPRYYIPQDIYKNIRKISKRKDHLKELFENMLDYVGIPASIVQFKIEKFVDNRKSWYFSRKRDWFERNYTLLFILLRYKFHCFGFSSWNITFIFIIKQFKILRHLSKRNTYRRLRYILGVWLFFALWIWRKNNRAVIF